MGFHRHCDGNGGGCLNLVIGPGVVEWVAKQTNEFGNFGCAVGIGLQKDGEIVAGVAYNDYNGPNISAHIAINGRINRRFIWAIFDYPFNQAKVNRVTCLIGEGNVRSRKLCEHFGFKEEARLSGAHPTGDLLIYRLFRHECRWLELKHEPF